jgi:hypothetical protein
MKSTQDMVSSIEKLGLSTEEAMVFLDLLQQPQSHLALSRSTGINRTKIYRVVQRLEQLSLITKQTDDRGTFLTAADPRALELLATEAEQAAMERRGVLQELLPRLLALKATDGSLFTTRSYNGVEGLKQMCWHELKARGELYALGGGTIEDLIPNRYWAEKHRQLTVEAGYRIYAIVNDPSEATFKFTDSAAFMKNYESRMLPAIVTRFGNQTIIYNDTVSVYHWRHDQMSGVEIINKAHADMMRQIFQHYWNLANPIEPIFQTQSL